ncbi:MAG: CBS domain-containing protein [Deltaproteobacteria bacterium]|nr:CBS domain-containing protein [Deltaproteobacteria bacterium]
MDVITCHIEADFDALASMVAAHRLYPEACIVFPGSQEKALREFISDGRLPDLPVLALRDLDRAAVRRLIVVDARSAERLGELGDLARSPDVELHVYDHHPPGPGGLRGMVEVSRPVGANTTLMLELLEERGMPVPPAEATLYLLGLYEETGCLTYPGTTPEDCETAARLLRAGADLGVVGRYLPGDFDAGQIALLDDLLKAASCVRVHGADVVLSQATRETHIEGLGEIATRAMGVLGARAFFAIARMVDRVFVVGRSRDPAVDAAHTLEAMGGGGHPSAAAATVKDRTLVETRDSLLDALQGRVRATRRARECMTSDVKTAAPGTPMREIAAMLSRLRFDTLPIAAEGKLLGLISRQTTDRALHHALGDAPAGDYMTTEFTALGPDAHLEEIASAMREHHQRLVPILEGGKLVGVVTRQDLVRAAPEAARLADLLPPAEDGTAGPTAGDESARRRALANLLDERLPGPLLAILHAAGEAGAAQGAAVYVVGGFVRDLLLGVPDYDLDLVVEGDGIAFATDLAVELGGEARTHEMFGTASIRLSGRPDLPGEGGAYCIDVASARQERYEHPGALPAIERSSLRRDLYRRDFTINTLAIDLSPARFGELLDFFGGQRDLKERRVRVLHGLSFVEDPTRAFRALRFEQRFHFRVGKFTERLFQTAAAHLEAVSGGRILNELILTLEEPRAAAILRRLQGHGLLRAIDPDFQPDMGCERRLDRVEEVLGWFRLLYTGEAVTAWVPAWLAATERIDRQAVARIEARLGVAGGHADCIGGARKDVPRALRALRAGAGGPPSALAAALRPLSLEALLWLMAVAEDEAARRAASRYITEWRNLRPALTGGDLLALGFAEGPGVGEALRRLLDARLDGPVATREDELAFAKRLLGAQN